MSRGRQHPEDDTLTRTEYHAIRAPVAVQTVEPLRCLRCWHEWVPRRAGIPKRCPSCLSFRWNKTTTKPDEAAPKPTHTFVAVPADVGARFPLCGECGRVEGAHA